MCGAASPDAVEIIDPGPELGIVGGETPSRTSSGPPPATGVRQSTAGMSTVT